MIFRNPKTATFWGSVLGRGLTAKHMVIRVLFSLMVGVALYFLLNSLNELNWFAWFIIVWMTLVAYALGYLWVVGSGIKEELGKRDR